MPKIQLEPLRGFRDILHPESKLLTRLAEVFAKIAEKHGYEKVIPPTLERFELFALKSGEEIRRSMYVFKDKAGREVALRPEATASVARIYLKHLRGKPKPLRLYYVVNCFRYEEPQRARYREFWQAGIEILGEPSILADFEAIKILTSFYRELGVIDKIVLKLGTTKLYRKVFEKFNIPETLQDHILHLMDKGMYDTALDEIRQQGHDRLADVLKQIWSKSDSPGKVKEILAEIVPEAVQAVEELVQLYSMIKSYEEKLQVNIDLSFARGLAYYTGVIYEVKVPGFPVSIAGGGRYDNLIAIYGEEDVPGTGFAIGLDRTLAALQEIGKASALLRSLPRAAIMILKPEHLVYAAQVQDILIGKDVETVVIPVQKLHKTLSRVIKQGYDYAVIIGDNEVKEKAVTIKILKSRKQVTMSLNNLKNIADITYIR